MDRPCNEFMVIAEARGCSTGLISHLWAWSFLFYILSVLRTVRFRLNFMSWMKIQGVIKDSAGSLIQVCLGFHIFNCCSIVWAPVGWEPSSSRLENIIRRLEAGFYSLSFGQRLWHRLSGFWIQVSNSYLQLHNAIRVCWVNRASLSHSCFIHFGQWRKRSLL